MLVRFTNKGLQDTCGRVGREPARKLAPHDRLIGSAILAYEMGITPAYIAIGVAAGLCTYMNESQEYTFTPEDVLEKICGLNVEGELFALVLETYDLIQKRKSLRESRKVADIKVAEKLQYIV